MFVRNGEALGSVHLDTAPGAEAPKRKPGRPRKEEAEPVVEDEKPEPKESKSSKSAQEDEDDLLSAVTKGKKDTSA